MKADPILDMALADKPFGAFEDPDRKCVYVCPEELHGTFSRLFPSSTPSIRAIASAARRRAKGRRRIFRGPDGVERIGWAVSTDPAPPWLEHVRDIVSSGPPDAVLEPSHYPGIVVAGVRPIQDAWFGYFGTAAPNHRLLAPAFRALSGRETPVRYQGAWCGGRARAYPIPRHELYPPRGTKVRQ